MKTWKELTTIGKKRRLNKILDTYSDFNRVNIVYSVYINLLDEARELILLKNNNVNIEITNLLK